MEANPYPKDPRQPKTFTLPVSGSVVLWGPETAIVASREFQRLAGLKQLGTSYVVFRGAIHTRFEHSIGALHEAERMVASINNNHRAVMRVDPVGRRIARLGSLLHDLTHVPFGHTLEDELHLLKRHDTNQVRFETLLVNSAIGEILRSSLEESEYALLLRILQAKEEEEFMALEEYAYVADIVGNTLCADLPDYVRRDLTGCGMPVALGDRFLDYLTITSSEEGSEADHYRTALNIGKRGMPRPDVESEIIKLLEYRYELAERVYFHHAKNSASVMIGRAVQEAGLATGEDTPPSLDKNFYWLSDELLLQSLANPLIHEALNLERGGQNWNLELVRRLAVGVLERDLFKIAYLAVDDDLAFGAKTLSEAYESPDERRQLEDRLAAQSGLERGDVLVHIPRTKMMMKEAEIRVRTNREEIVSLKDWDLRHSRRVNALNEAHRRLWRIAVYVRPDRFESHGTIVRAAAESEFKAPPRYVREPGYTPLESALFDEVIKKDRVVADKEEILVGLKSLDTAKNRSEIEENIRARIRLAREKDGES